MHLTAFAVLAVLPFAAHAATTNVFGPIIPDITSGGVCSCAGSAPDWGCVLQVFQTLLNTIVSVSLVLLTLFIAYAGIQFMLSPTSEEQRLKARKTLTNALIGLVVILGAWLIVDSVMKVIYNGSAQAGTAQFGPWNALLTPSTDYCIFQHGTPAALPGISTSTATGAGTTASGDSNVLLNYSASGGSCSAATVQQGASAGGYTLTNTQASELACIAQWESTCGTKNPPYNLNYSWNKPTSNGKASTAAGAFQVLMSTNSACYDNPACEQAGGTPGVALNCKSGFDSSGFPKNGSPVVQKCEQAAGNVACSASAAACQLQHQNFAGPGGMYTADAHASSCQS